MRTVLAILGWLWSIPVTLFGLVVFAFCAPNSPRWRWWGFHGTRGIIEVELGRWFAGYAAITFGHLQGYLPGRDRQRLRPHEDTHTFQGDLLGIFDAVYFIFLAGIFLWQLVRTRDRRRAADLAYWDNPLERWARAWERRGL